MAAARGDAPRKAFRVVSNLLKRVLVGALGIPLLLYVAVHGGWALIAMIVLLQAVSLWEWTRMYAANGSRLNAVGMFLMTAACRAYRGTGHSALLNALTLTASTDLTAEDRYFVRDLTAPAPKSKTP